MFLSQPCLDWSSPLPTVDHPTRFLPPLPSPPQTLPARYQLQLDYTHHNTHHPSYQPLYQAYIATGGGTSPLSRFTCKSMRRGLGVCPCLGVSPVPAPTISHPSCRPAQSEAGNNNNNNSRLVLIMTITIPVTGCICFLYLDPEIRRSAVPDIKSIKTNLYF